MIESVNMNSGIRNKALVISTSKLPGDQQMDIDLYFLDKTISNPEIRFSLNLLLGRRLAFYWTSSKVDPTSLEKITN